MKRYVTFILSFCFFLSGFGQSNGKVKKADFEIISKIHQISTPGIVPQNAPPGFGVTECFTIRLRALSPNIYLDSIYFSGDVVENVYTNPLPQGEELVFILSIPYQSGKQKPFIKNANPKSVIFRYKKRNILNYLKIEKFEETRFLGL